MIETVPFEDDRILGMRIGGKVSAADLEPVLARLDVLLAGQEPLRAYVEVADVEGVSTDALIRDVQYGLAHFKSLLTRFEKVAVVTDKGWVKRLSQLENLLMPGTDQRVFAFADIIEAQAWVRQ